MRFTSPPPDRSFHVADLGPQGDLLLQSDYTYVALEQVPFAQELIIRCSTHLWSTPDEFELALPSPDPDELRLRWRQCALGAGLLTVRCGGQIASLSVLAGGVDPDGDQLTLDALQRHVLHELHDTGFEPAFEMLRLSKRPLLSTLLLCPPANASSRLTVAIADRCFAAAYFRYLQLV